jgi:DNA-binding protein HU-beta
MNKTQLISAVAERTGIAKSNAALAIDAAIDIVKDEIKSGGSVQLIGFGTFERRDRAARSGFNPATNEKIEIAASKVPAFKPGKQFKEEVNNG